MADGAAPSAAAHGRRRPRRAKAAAKGSRKTGTLYGALDLGTNNCRLLIAAADKNGFRVVDSYSQIVRLGEGLGSSGVLRESAMERALAALRVCARKLKRQRVRRMRCVATQACRAAGNGAEFLAKVHEVTGLRLQTISTEQEARLALRGCANLLDPSCDAALVVDIGGGSTELSWVDLRPAAKGGRPIPGPCVSLPIGVVNMAERFPESADRGPWFAAMRAFVREQVGGFTGADAFARVFREGAVHGIGTSGAVTSLGGLHLNLPRYIRSRVDGLWLSRRDVEEATARLLAKNLAERACEPCIGKERADLVLAGCAILAAIDDVWPTPRIRVADRGLREGLLLGMIGADRRRARHRHKRTGKKAGANDR